MVPNPTDCDQETKRPPHSPSPTQKHRRSKTGKTRKKRRQWGLFSRWKTSESEDDDDLELYRWSKSRGLTARTLPLQTATQPPENQPKTNRIRYHDHADSKSAVQHRGNSNSKENIKRAVSANSIASLQEAVFLAKLCPSIKDKRSFVDCSKNRTENDNQHPKTVSADKKAIGPAQRQVQKHEGQDKSAPIDMEVKNDTKNVVPENTKPSLPAIETPSFKSGEEIKVDKQNKETVAAKEATKEASQAGKQNPSSSEPIPTSCPSPPANYLLKKEWSASVESNILRLYESTNTIRTGTNLVYSWATPNAAPAPPPQPNVVIPRTVEQKIEQAEYTPSYVQMLAKMFKNRMQIRKEREERVEENLKRSRLSFDFIGNSASSVKSDNAPPKTNAYPQLNPHPISKAHLRYRHIADKKEAQQNPIEMSRTIRIDQLDVGYTHGRYSKALKYSPDKSTGKMSDDANSETWKSDRVVSQSQSETISKCDERPGGEDHKRLFKLYNQDPSSKLQKPTPHLTTFGHINKQDAKSTLMLAKRARKNPPLSRLTPHDTIQNMQANKTGPFQKESHELFDLTSIPVRWSTSVGSLYCRPPARILSKPAAQKA